MIAIPDFPLLCPVWPHLISVWPHQPQARRQFSPFLVETADRLPACEEFGPHPEIYDQDCTAAADLLN